MKEAVIYSSLIAGIIVLLSNLSLLYIIYNALKKGNYTIEINANDLLN